MISVKCGLTMLGGVTRVRYANLDIYVALRRAKDCCRWSLLKAVIACKVGDASWITEWICCAWKSARFDIAAPRIITPSCVVLIDARSVFPERSTRLSSSGVSAKMWHFS